MSVQQINLYQSMFRPRRQWLGGRTLLLATLLLLVLQAGLYHFGSAQVRQAEAQAAVAERHYHSAVERLQQVARARAAGQTSPTADADAELERLAAEYAARRQLLTHLSQQSLGNGAGFADHLAGLARQRPDGLWLTRVRLDARGTLELEGGALEPEAVPRFVQRLSREASFAGTEFHRFRLTRDPQGSYLRFSLGTGWGDS